MIKKILVLLLKTLHVLYIIFTIIAPYIFSDIRILLFLILLYILTLAQWYIFDRCLLTNIEDWLSEKKTIKYKDGSDKSFMTIYLQKNFHISERSVYYLFTMIPIINGIVCVIKIYYIYLNKCINK
jgi:hypothetical protein